MQECVIITEHYLCWGFSFLFLLYKQIIASCALSIFAITATLLFCGFFSPSYLKPYHWRKCVYEEKLFVVFVLRLRDPDLEKAEIENCLCVASVS